MMEKSRSSFFFNPLSSRLLWAFVLVHFLFAISLGKIYIFAPDEGLYVGIFKEAYRAGFSTAGLMGWSNSPLYFLQAIYLPGKLLVMVGLPDYLAIRILAILTSAAAIYLLMCVSRTVRGSGSRPPRVLIAALFIPSSFLWMTLGLRESFIFLALAMICSGIYLLSHMSMRNGFLLLSFGNLTLFNTKSYLFLLVLMALLLQLAFGLLSRSRARSMQLYVVLALVLPLVINPSGVKYLTESIKGQINSVSATGSSSTAGIPNQSIDVGTTGLGLVSACSDSKSFFGAFLKKTGSCASEPSAPSAPAHDISRMNVSPADLRNPLSVMARAGGFLFTPFPFIDNGSMFLNIAALESPLWWFLYFTFGLTVWRRFKRKEFDGLAIFVVSFVALFVVFSAFTEINVGTMIRHRSVLLIPMLFLVTSQSKKPIDT